MTALADLIHFLASNGSELVQRGTFPDNHLISGPRNGDEATQQQFTFFNTKAGDQVASKIRNSIAALIIVERSLISESLVFPESACIISAPVAKKAMMECASVFFVNKPQPGIHPQAIIHESAVIGENASIHAGAVISENVQIGNQCIIEPNVYIHPGTQVGNHVYIKANAVIGGNGFGYVKSDSGAFEHVPHFGRVNIEDDVHIGSNTCIDRGSLSDTIIGKGVKIDNLVHIAHNVEIGENTLVIACAMIAGSVRIGSNAWIAPAASVKNGITIGDNTTIGMASLVLKPVADGITVAGVPAKELGK